MEGIFMTEMRNNMIKKYDENIQREIKNDLTIFLNSIKEKVRSEVSKADVSIASTAERVSSNIEAIFKKVAIQYKNDKFEIKNSTDSTKSPYDLLLVYKSGREVYIDLKPANKTSRTGESAPFLGTINKFINRLQDEHYYDVLVFVNYSVSVGKRAEYLDYKIAFMKDLQSYTIYDNWQMQDSINSMKIVEFLDIEDTRKYIISALQKMKANLIKKAEVKVESRITHVSEIKLDD